MIDRRTLLASAAATATLAAAGFAGPALAQAALKTGPSAPFSFEALKTRARALAAAPYNPPPRANPEILEQIDYDAHGKIKFKTDLALWANGPSDYPVTFFHLGRFFQKPVRMHAVEGGQAREIVYDDAYFDMPADSPAHKLPDNSGFAGFRFQESRKGSLDWRTNDWVAFLGGSYFRAIGELFQYGLSARGLAVDTAVHGKIEEFPDFTHVYFETPQAGSDTVVVCALLDGASVSGAFRFTMRRAKAVIIDVEKALYLREDIDRLGIAPLTSMYWYSEKAKPSAIDWRPEIHDSDGLALWTGTGERIWRPLNNPPRTITSAFSDETRRASASSSATAPSIITSTASITTAAPRCGSSRRALGARGRCSSSRFPPTTRSTTTSWPCGCRPSPPAPARRSSCATAPSGRPRSPSRPRSPAWSRPASAMAARPARCGRRGCASSWWSSAASP
jgi:glucans biosynthesis protein